MKFILLCIFISVSFSMTLKMKQTLQLDGKFSEIKNTALGRMLNELIELHLQIGGPVEELMQAVEEFITELEVKKQREIESYERLRGEYLDLVQQFEAQISKAKLDISTSESKIEIILKPRLDHLKQAVDQMAQNLQENSEQYNEEEQQRNEKHIMYTKLSTEFKLALDTVQQSMELILNMGNQRPNFLQVNKAKRSISQLKSTLDRLETQYSPLVATLVNLSQNEFDNPQVIEQIITLLKALQEQVADHFATVAQQENKESDDWNVRSAYLNEEHTTFVQRKTEYETEYQQTEVKITQETEFKAARQDELTKINADLKQESADWERQTAIHDELMTRIENDHNLTLVAKQNILQHSDQINKFADTKRKKVEYQQSEKLWD